MNIIECEKCFGTGDYLYISFGESVGPPLLAKCHYCNGTGIAYIPDTFDEEEDHVEDNIDRWS